MKELFLSFLVFFSISAIAQEVHQSKLVEKKGKFYQKGKETEFSGEAISYFSTGEKEKTFTYKKGKLINEVIYYKTGEKERLIEYKRGKRHGKFIVWYKNKSIKCKGQYKRDMKKGEWIWYNEDGSEKTRKKYKREAG